MVGEQLALALGTAIPRGKDLGQGGGLDRLPGLSREIPLQQGQAASAPGLAKRLFSQAPNGFQ